MASTPRSDDKAHEILDRTYETRPAQEERPQNPTVLSCGGIFIPQPPERRLEFRILHTANDREPTKVVSGITPRNMLQLVMAKESLN